MFCRICARKASINIRHHNLSLCKGHFVERFFKETESTIKKFDMFTKADRVLVAVSGGKDSLALWFILTKLGYNTTGLYINLGIDKYSDISEVYCKKMSEELSSPLIVKNSIDIAGAPAPLIDRKRSHCSACGLFKRYTMNEVALKEGFNVIVTGHNLDDEVATLLSNTLKWDDGFLARQDVVLPEEDNFAKRAKPFCFLTEKETLAFCIFECIEIYHQECPYSYEATSIFLKKIWSKIEEEMPGTKLRFYKEFLKLKKKYFKREVPQLVSCSVCGNSTIPPKSKDAVPLCSYCRMLKNKNTIQK